MSTSAITTTSNAGLITSLGAGTSLDLASLLDSLQTAELAQTSVINNRISSAQTKISAYGTLQNSVQTVLTAAQTLAKASAFNSVKASVTGSDVTASTSSGAIAGTYKVVVTALAQADQLQSATAIDSATAKDNSFGSGGTITITLADGSSQTIDLSGNTNTTLQGVINAINNNTSAGLNATEVSDGNGGYYLMLTGSKTGATNAIASISVSGNSTLASALDYTAGSSSGNLTLTQSAQNAALTVNGIAVTSATNTIENIIDNVTLTVNSVTASGGSNTVSIANDPSVAQNAVQAFVTAYNSLQTTIANLTKFDTDAGTSSALTGDNTTHRVRNALAQSLQVYMGSGFSVQSLADVGIKMDPLTGKLNFDSSKLATALSSHGSDVANLFTDATNGLAAKIQSATNAILGKSGLRGMITSATSSLQQTVTALQTQYTNLLNKVTGDMNRYRTQFSNLSTLLSTMNSTSSYLTQQFAAMNKSSS